MGLKFWDSVTTELLLIYFFLERYSLGTLKISYMTVVNYLFAGIPIFNALLFIIIISATILSEVIAPTRNIALKAIAFGTDEVTPSEVCTSAVYIDKKSPAITGPIAPPIIRIVL